MVRNAAPVRGRLGRPSLERAPTRRATATRKTTQPLGGGRASSTQKATQLSGWWTFPGGGRAMADQGVAPTQGEQEAATLAA